MDIQKLKEQLSGAEKEFKEQLFETYVAHKLKPTPLKTLQESKNESLLQIDDSIRQFKDDLSRGYQCYQTHVFPEEEDRLKLITDKFFKFIDPNAQMNLDDKEAVFLEEIAKREMMKGNHSDASCMFRFIIQITNAYSPAWVGWALAEHAQGHQSETDLIFELGMEMMPLDYFILLYAAEFFMTTDRKERAREILQKAADRLIQVNAQDTFTFKEVNQLISKL